MSVWQRMADYFGFAQPSDLVDLEEEPPLWSSNGASGPANPEEELAAAHARIRLLEDRLARARDALDGV